MSSVQTNAQGQRNCEETEGKDLILQVQNLKMYFPVMGGAITKKVGDLKAVDDVSFELERGKTMGLVGESGCGKTTIGKCILRLHRATGGQILYNGQDIVKMSKKDFAKLRREIQIVFQDPLGSLDPRQSVYSTLKETLMIGGKYKTREEVERRINELLDAIEVDREYANNYPHELSRGQLQRLGIARALACDPELVVCDEPVSALDVSIQAQVINLLRRMQKEMGLSYIFIAHDISVVYHIADVIAVMYLGHIMETVESGELYAHPMHPYTLALLSAVPVPDYDVEQNRKRIVLTGEVPSPINAPRGCPFHPRCTYATERCRSEVPQLRDMGGGHLVACHNLEQIHHLEPGQENGRKEPT